MKTGYAEDSRAAEPGQIEVSPALVTLSANGETPVWCMRERSLYWIDVERRRLHRFSPATGAQEQWEMAEQVGAIALCRSGRVLVAMRSRLMLFNPADGREQRVADAPFDPELYRFNDGRCDPLGRFWVGTKSEPRSGAPRGSDEPAPQHLWRLDRTGVLHQVPATAAIANGIGWSLDFQTLYFTDTARRTIYKYGFDLESGKLGHRRRFASLGRGQGKPDGCAVDSDGHYWVAAYGGSSIFRFTPAGERAGAIALPVTQPTMCAFGGEDLRTMYITTASSGLDEAALRAEPLAGSLLQCRPGCRGMPPDLFDDELLLAISR